MRAIIEREVSVRTNCLNLAADQLVLMQNKYNNLSLTSGGILELARKKFMQRGLAKAEKSFVKAIEEFEAAVRKQVLFKEASCLVISKTGNCLSGDKMYSLTNIGGRLKGKKLRVHELSIYSLNGTRDSRLISCQTVGFLNEERLPQEVSEQFFNNYLNIIKERCGSNIPTHPMPPDKSPQDYFSQVLSIPNMGQISFVASIPSINLAGR